MKKSIFLLFLTICCSFFTAYGQKLIALQHNGVTTLFTTIPAAVTAAVSGDTIYLPGGSFPGFNIDKKLAIIGVGHHPDSTSATGMTLISGHITMNTSNSGGSVFTGLRVNAIQNISGDNDNVQVSRCFVSGAGIIPESGVTGSENWIISECYITRIQTIISNSLVSNNLIVGRIENASGCQINNNIFLMEDINYNPISANSSVIKNNVFKRIDAVNIGGNNNNQFNNNIWSADAMPNGVFGNGNIGTGNINDTNFDGLFTNFSYATYAGTIDNLYQFDFHLVNAAYNTGGTDGTPIGIYGGTFPWKDGSIPFNPRILLKSIGNTTDQSGNLLINIQVEAQDH